MDVSHFFKIIPMLESEKKGEKERNQIDIEQLQAYLFALIHVKSQ